MPNNDAEPARHDAADPSHVLTCEACRVIDRADGVEDGQLWNPAHYSTDSRRDLVTLMRRLQDHTADTITSFAGSMRFVYIHIVLFSVWMLVFERSPWPTLTLIVSLEAIFLSTFVMIGQNRQASFQQAKADHDYIESEKMLGENTDITRSIHQLTLQLHAKLVGPEPSAGE